jgi:hypothetical protein
MLSGQMNETDTEVLRLKIIEAIPACIATSGVETCGGCKTLSNCGFIKLLGKLNLIAATQTKLFELHLLSFDAQLEGHPRHLTVLALNADNARTIAFNEDGNPAWLDPTLSDVVEMKVDVML